MAFDLPNLKISSLKTLPRAAINFGDRGLLLHIRTNLDFISRNWHYQSIQKALICKTWKFWVQKWSHTPAHAIEDPKVTVVTNTRHHLLPCTRTRQDEEFMRLHDLCAYQGRDVVNDVSVTSSSRLTRVFRPDPKLWTRFEPPTKKKLWPKLTFDFNQKSKFSKRTYPTWFFTYIPILGSVSSSETRKLHKQSNF